jgi:hypothetical protein
MTPRNALPYSCLAAGCALVIGVLGAGVGTGVAAPEPAYLRSEVPLERRDANHLYRIVGKVRPLFFWVGADDVGGARITWRGGKNKQSVALLIGSDPQRAPRGVNEWGYIREDVGNDSTTVFGIRTVTDGESPDEVETRRTEPGRMAELGVLCSTVSRREAASRTTTVYVDRDATYRDIDRVLDVVERDARWGGRRTTRPADVAPGFLTALDLMMRSSALDARTAEAMPARPRLSYVYKDAVYDLIPRRIDRVPYLRTRGGLFRDLLRSQISVRNQATGSTSGFAITYGTEGALAGVPIAATYQPNWWFKVELELDEEQDVPPDPAGDASLGRRIAVLCSASGE